MLPFLGITTYYILVISNFNMKKIIKLVASVFTILLVLTLGVFVWAESNGIWHDAKDVRGGIFGEDEPGYNQNYTFANPVDFQDEITANTIKVTTIKSNSANGNVVIQLG